MTIFPHSKINIGLRVISKREDGYHNIESIFYPVNIRDVFEFVVQDNGSDSDEFTQTGFPAGCAMNDNLLIKALNLIRAKYNIPALRMHLHKAIPLGAGLGGGSSDAAFMLKYLNRYFRLGLCNNDLRVLALELGSDCPFFIEQSASYVSGRGEILKRVKLLLDSYYIVLINPGIHINTGEAYSGLIPRESEESLIDYYTRPVSDWKKLISNDFEESIFRKYPEIEGIKKELYSNGAVYSSMSGSGSSVYGIFESEPPGNIFPDYWSWTGTL